MIMCILSFYLIGKNAYYLSIISGHPLANELRHSMEENSHKIGELSIKS